MNWNEITADAWRSYRNKINLSASPLAQTNIVQACLLVGDDAANLRFGVRAILLWTLMQLDGTGQKRHAQQAEVLRLRYVDGLTVGQVAARLNRLVGTVKSQQRAGIKTTAELLAREAAQPQGVGWYRPKSIELRIASRTADEQTLLRFLAVFRRPVPLYVTVSAEEIVFQPHAHTLQQANLLLQSADGLDLHPEVRVIVTSLTPHKILLDNHTIAARFYARIKLVGAAIYHWQYAGQQAIAAELVLTQAAQLGTDTVLSLLDNFVRSQLPRDVWAQLQLLRGQTVERSQQKDSSLDAAIVCYEDALSAADLLIQAEACYRLGCAYQRRDVQEALIHYESAEQLLIPPPNETARQLLANVYISRAWIHIEQLADKTLAQGGLESAEKYLSTEEDEESLQLRSDWYNAWGGFYLSHQQFKQSQTARRQAWLLARRAGDVTRTIQTGYNLGIVYLFMQRYPDAYRFLLESRGLAQERGNQRMVALCNKTLGGYYVVNGEQYIEAQKHYQLAYDHFKQSGNDFWLASTCHDLAELSMLCGNWRESLQFLQEGEHLVDGETKLSAALERLKKQFPALSNGLTDEQREILHYACTHGSINKRICSDLIGEGERTSLREINKLVEKALLHRVGKGPATKYVC